MEKENVIGGGTKNRKNKISDLRPKVALESSSVPSAFTMSLASPRGW